jgi:hypothetical protein
MHIFWLQQFLDEQDLIVKGNLVCEIRCKGSRFRGSRLRSGKLGASLFELRPHKTPRQAGFRVWFQVSAQPLAAEVYPPQEGGQFVRKRNFALG